MTKWVGILQRLLAAVADFISDAFYSFGQAEYEAYFY